jgi:hypothetical protein
VEGTGAGAGAVGAFDAAQQAAWQQCPLLQQVFATGEIPGLATIGYAASKNASSHPTTNLVNLELLRKTSKASHRAPRL